MMNFAGRLNSALGKAGITQAQLAVMLKVTPQAVQKWCAGRSAPKMSKIQTIAIALDVSETWLITSDNRTPAAGRVQNVKQRVLDMIESTNEESDLLAIEDVIAAIIRARGRDSGARK